MPVANRCAIAFCSSQHPLADDFFTSRLSLTRNLEDWRSGNSVLHTTIQTFKGMDVDIVILIEAPGPDTHSASTTNYNYFGESLVRSILHVMNKEAAVLHRAA